MPSNSHASTDAAFTVLFRGLKVQCDTVEHVVEAVRVLAPLEREVPVPRQVDPEVEREEPISVPSSPVAIGMYDLFRKEPRWRRPIEIVKELKRRRIQDAKYTTVYAVLRYGDFVKREGRWNVRDEATL